MRFLLFFLPGRCCPGFFASLACVLTGSAAFMAPSTSGGDSPKGFPREQIECEGMTPARPVEHASACGWAAQRPSA